MRGGGSVFRRLAPILAFALVLAAFPATPASANDDTQAQTEAILARIAHAPNPDRAFLALSRSDQAAVIRYLTPVRFVTSQTASVTTTGGHSASLAASGCTTVHNWIRSLNAFNVTVYQYNHQIGYCYDGWYVYNVNSLQAWPSNVIFGWQYLGEGDRYSNGGNWQTYFEWHTNGRFGLCIGGWCAQQQFPWLNTRVYGDGWVAMGQGIN